MLIHNIYCLFLLLGKANEVIYVGWLWEKFQFSIWGKYSNIYMHTRKWWFVAWQHQNITRTNVASTLLSISVLFHRKCTRYSGKNQRLKNFRFDKTLTHRSQRWMSGFEQYAFKLRNWIVFPPFTCITTQRLMSGYRTIVYVFLMPAWISNCIHY